MLNVFYSFVGCYAILLHCIINSENLNPKNEKSETGMKYRWFLYSVLIYFLSDTCWGMLSIFGNRAVLYWETVFFCIATVMLVVTWNSFVISFLKEQGIFRVIFMYGGTAFLITELLILIVNVFYPFYFFIEEDGTYVAGKARIFVLAMQTGLFLLTSIRALVHIQRLKKIPGSTARRWAHRSLAVCVFGQVMVLSGMIQNSLPMFPIRTLGLLAGCCCLHIYLVEDTRAEYVARITNEHRLIEALSRTLEDVFLVDLDKDVSETFKINGKIVREQENNRRSYRKTWEDYIQKYIHEEDREYVRKRCSAEHVVEQLGLSDSYMFRYRILMGETMHYYQARFSRIEDDRHLIMGFECVDAVVQAEKAKEDEIRNLTGTNWTDGLTDFKT